MIPGDITAMIKPNKKRDLSREYAINRKPAAEASDYERYADIIEAYRAFIGLTAIDCDIHLGRGIRRIPDGRADLIEWVKNPDNLDAVARAVRRNMSVYVSTGRLFAIQYGPASMDWPAVGSMISHAEDVLRGALAFLDISGRGNFDDLIGRIEDALNLIVEAEALPCAAVLDLGRSPVSAGGSRV